MNTTPLGNTDSSLKTRPKHEQVNKALQLCYRSLFLPSRPDTTPPLYTSAIYYNNKLVISFLFNHLQSSVHIIFESEQARSIFVMLARMWMLFADSNGVGNQSVTTLNETPASDAYWLLYHIYQALCGWMHLVIPNLSRQTAVMSLLGEDSDTSRALCLSYSVRSHHYTTSFQNDVYAPVVDTDDYDTTSSTASFNGEWKSNLCIYYHDKETSKSSLCVEWQNISVSYQGQGILTSAYNFSLPDHLSMLDSILPTDLPILSVEDVYPLPVTLGKGSYGEVSLYRMNSLDGPLVAVKSCMAPTDKSKQPMYEFLVTLEAVDK
ncbi:uncharacterized protein [Antedon mediterranea]